MVRVNGAPRSGWRWGVSESLLSVRPGRALQATLWKDVMPGMAMLGVNGRPIAKEVTHHLSVLDGPAQLLELR